MGLMMYEFKIKVEIWHIFINGKNLILFKITVNIKRTFTGAQSTWSVSVLQMHKVVMQNWSLADFQNVKTFLGEAVKNY